MIYGLWTLYYFACSAELFNIILGIVVYAACSHCSGHGAGLAEFLFYHRITTVCCVAQPACNSAPVSSAALH